MGLGQPSGDRPDRPPGRLVEIIALVHLSYLATLPFLGICGQVELGRRLPVAVGRGVLWCWPVLIYLGLLFRGYTLARHPARALFVLLATPLQLAYVQHLVVGGAFTFFYEGAVVQIGSLAIGITVASIIYRPSGWSGAVVALLVTAAWIPYCMPLLRTLHTWPWDARILLAVAALTSVWGSTSLVSAAAERYVKGGGVQRPELAHGRSGIARLLGKDSRTAAPPLEQRWARWVVAVTIVALNVGVWAAWIAR